MQETEKISVPRLLAAIVAAKQIHVHNQCSVET